MLNNLEIENKEKPEFLSLIRLIDDENEFVYQNVKEKFVSYGKETLNFLEEYLKSEDNLISLRAKEICDEINFRIVERKIREISYKEDMLEEASFAIAEYGYPDINKEKYKKRLDNMADDIRKKFDEEMNLSADSKIKIFNKYLFDEKNFDGNTEEFYETDNSYINRVLDRRTGIPISLSVVYILISHRLGLPVTGMNIPNHFIVKYKDEKDEFFIDVFNKGVLISKIEAVNFMKRFGVEEKDFNDLPFLQSSTDREIVLRMFANLINVYEKESKANKVEQLKKLQSYFG